MLDKYFLLNKIVKSLIREDFEVFVTKGCFDVAARREKIFLLKILLNIDALQKEHAFSLITVSHFVSAYPFVISEKNNREFLEENVVYYRFGLPVINSQTFEKVLNSDNFLIQAAKGKHSINIDAQKLRETRLKFGYSLSYLSKLLGISKKALYEIEKNKSKPSEKTFRKMEKILKVNLTLPFKYEVPRKIELKPRNSFQKNVLRKFSTIGIESSPSYFTPFEIIGREKFSLITKLSNSSSGLKMQANVVKKLSSVFCSKAFFVVKNAHKECVEEVPVISEKELTEISCAKELNELIEKRQA